MEVIHQWHDADRTIAYSKLTGNFTWPEFHASADELARFIRQVQHSVCVISDVQDAVSPPGNPLRSLRYVEEAMPENVAMLVLIRTPRRENLLISAFLNVRRLLGNRPIQQTTTLQEALMLVASYRAEQR